MAKEEQKTDLAELPRYRQVKHMIRDKILAGDYVPGTQIPNEFYLAEQYRVSRLTVNKAIGELVQENWLYRDRGKGTFVNDRKAQPDLVVHVVSAYAARHPRLSPPAEQDVREWFIDHDIMQGVIEACKDLGCQARFVGGAGEEWDRLRLGERRGVLMLDLDVPAIRGLVERGCVVVVPYFPVPSGLCSNVITNWKEIFCEATKHLQALGHRRIALLATTRSPDEKSALRLEGYVQAIRQIGEYDPALVAPTAATLKGVAEALTKLLALPQKPTALMASSDLGARYALRLLQERGLRVPGEMAVVGFDDDPESGRCVPTLTTCHAPHFECGYEAVNLLKKLVRRELEGVQRIVIPSRLVVRESCGAKERARP